MKKVWASAGESEAKLRSPVKSRVAGGGPAATLSARKTPTRYPPPSAEEIPEIEPTAVIEDGSGGNDVASGEAAHDHVAIPSGPGGGANAPGGPPTQRWKCTSSFPPCEKDTVPVARMRMLVTVDGKDTQGGAVPPPPPAGAGGSAMPAPKMFEVPRTSIVEAVSHRDGSIVEGAVLGRVCGAERREHAPVTKLAPMMATSR
jgi:hypothetical protein